MNNKTDQLDSTPIFSELLFERLSPKITPEMGFQSYEQLEDDGQERKAQEKAFHAGEIRNPYTTYPLIDELVDRYGVKNNE